MKYLITICACLLLHTLTAQKGLHYIIGSRIHTSDYEAPTFPQATDLRSSLLLGLEWQIPFSKYSLSYLNDRTYSILNPADNRWPSNIYSVSIGNLISIGYIKNRQKFSIGHYWHFNESDLDFYLGFKYRTRRYINLGYSLSFGNAEIEYIKLIQYSRIFVIRGIDLNSIVLKYKMGGTKKSAAAENKYSVQFKAGLRGFMVRNTYFLNEERNQFGNSVIVGIAVPWRRIYSTFFFDRDYWVKLNGGSPSRQVKGYVATSVVGINFRPPQLHSFGVSLGYAFIRDNSTIDDTRVKIRNKEADISLWYYNVKGVSIGINYRLFKNYNLDIRGIIPLKGEAGFNPMRYSLGVSYIIKS